MNRPYSWTRTRALLGELWAALTSHWRYCKAEDWSIVPRARCVKDRGHRGPHVDENSHSWANKADWPFDDAIVAGHIVHEPETVYCPCAGECHDHRKPCSPSCIVHRLRETRR